MSSSLKFKKVYIDTKFMTADSNSTSDFNIELPETMYFDNNSSVFYIDDVSFLTLFLTGISSLFITSPGHL